MDLKEFALKNDLDLNYVFLHAKYRNKEGLMFFEPIAEENDEGELEEYFEPKCIIIDGAKFVYEEEMDNEIVINAKDNKIVFNKLNGKSFELPKSDFSEFPFELKEFEATKPKFEKPENFVEIT